jgi:hypothetical protein
MQLTLFLSGSSGPDQPTLSSNKKDYPRIVQCARKILEDHNAPAAVLEEFKAFEQRGGGLKELKTMLNRFVRSSKY